MATINIHGHGMTEIGHRQGKMHRTVHQTFLSRIEFLLGNRKKYPWGFSLGLTRGTINRLFKGYTPGLDILTTISRCENARLDWLTSGSEPPFHVIDRDDADHARMIREHVDHRLCDAVYLVTTYGRFSVVLTAPAKLCPPNKDVIHYTGVDIHGGGVGPLALMVVTDAIGNIPVMLVDMPETAFDKLVTGYMSNLDLIGLEGSGGYLSEHTAITSKKALAEYLTARGIELPTEKTAVSGVNEDRAEYSSEEMKLIQAYRSLPDEKRKALLLLVS